MSIRCPRCKYDQETYQAPAGKVVRNPAALSNGVMYDTCIACFGTGEVPTAVLESIKQGMPKVYETILQDPKLLRWSGDHYSIMAYGMYVGCELDGYCHT